MSNEKRFVIDYEELQHLTEEMDSYFEIVSGGWAAAPKLREERKEEYWRTRTLLESKIASWMANIRKAINALPLSVRKFTKLERTDPGSGDTYLSVEYDDINFEALMKFFDHIVSAIEGYNGVFERIKEMKPVYERLRAIRGDVLSLSESLELFTPSTVTNVEQQIELTFKLRDSGLKDIASLVEEIDQIEDNTKKCLNIRTALEKTIESYCERKGIEVKKGFYTNLDNAVEAGLTDKAKRNSIGGHYSFLSKMVHGEIEADIRNTQFAVNGTLNILRDLLP